MVKQSDNTKWALGAKSATVGLIAACAVCCAPLIASIVTGLLAAIGLGAYATALVSGKGFALLVLMAGAVAIMFWRQKSKARQCASDAASCACTSDQP